MSGRNIQVATLFGNIGILDRRTTVESECFERNRREIVRNRNNVTMVENLIENGYVKDKQGIERVLGIQLNFVEYFRISVRASGPLRTRSNPRVP
jgi:hypothetical protein